MIEELNFDSIIPIEVPVTIAGNRYVLTEASGEAAAIYRDAILSGTRLNDQGKASGFTETGGVNKAELGLLARTLYIVNPPGSKEERTPVLMSVVGQWPDRITQQLVKKVKQISDMDRKAEEQENPTINGQNDTKGG